MKRLLLLFPALLACFSLNAQEIKPLKAEFSDYLPLLNGAGYEVFAFDISSLAGSKMSFELVCNEYSYGELVEKDDEDQIHMVQSGVLTGKFTIGFAPAKVDSLKSVRLVIDNVGTIGINLKLKPITASSFNGGYYYHLRPFVVDSLKLDGFTPLVLLGSSWYDERYDIIRFCGEREFPSDMVSDTFKLIPHYYVIGVEAKQKQQ